jgi:hypothetical protein
LADVIAGSDSLAAVIDREGRVLGASGGFDALEPASAALDALILRAERGDEAVVRESVTVGDMNRDAGVARFSAGGERLFLLVVGPDRAASPVAAAGSTRPQAVWEASRIEEIETATPREQAAQPEPVAEPTPVAAPATPSPGGGTSSAEPVRDRVAPAPPRFLWRTDAAGGFTFVSAELAKVVGEPNVAAMGETWSRLASRLALDPDGWLADAIERLASFADVTVHWPVAGTREAVAVDLTGVPEFARDRTFRGHRGFGSIRLAARGPLQHDLASVGQVTEHGRLGGARAGQRDPQQRNRCGDGHGGQDNGNGWHGWLLRTSVW